MTDCREALAYELAERRRAILEMPAGEELNAEVQAAVFGSTIYHGHNFHRIVLDEPHALEAEVIPRYSTDPGAAWLVIEALPGCCTTVSRENVAGIRYDVTVNLDIDHVRTFHVMADTMPLAICRAALLATFEAR